MNFNKWLDTFLSEKEVDINEGFTFYDHNGDFNLMDYGVVVEAMKNACDSDKNSLKHKMVQLDFLNGDIRHFLRAMGKAVANM